ncbi:hypothetical protein NHX12_021351, partial [Muraenolepis orangiensis]
VVKCDLSLILVSGQALAVPTPETQWNRDEPFGPIPADTGLLETQNSGTASVPACHPLLQTPSHTAHSKPHPGPTCWAWSSHCHTLAK